MKPLLPRISSLVFTLAAGCATMNTSSLVELPTVAAMKTADLAPIQRAIGTRSIVLLGESIHMTRELTQAREILIRRLHGDAGFETLYFEGSPVEFWIAQDEYLASNGRPDAVVTFQKTALFGLWQTLEIRSVLDYALGTQRTAIPLYISSYDVQIGQGRRYMRGKTSVFSDLISRLNHRGAKITAKENASIRSLDRLAFCKQKRFPADAQAERAARSAIRTLDAVIRRLPVEPSSGKSMHLKHLEALPETLGFSLGFCKDALTETRNYTETRDDWAARQFQQIQKRIPSKAIIWAHVNHSRLSKNVHGRDSFGSYMRQARPGETYGIAFLAKEGSAISFMNEKEEETDFEEKQLVPLARASLESKIASTSAQDVFVESKTASSFLSEQETMRAEPIFVVPIRTFEAFDAYYLVQKVSPPTLDW